MTRRVALWLPALLALAFAAITWLALESQEVIGLRTLQDDGSVRTTRVWVAEEDGALWVEAATAERPWLLDLRERPRIEIERDHAIQCVMARLEPDPGGHLRIRQLLRRRYGWADAWVGLLQDTSGSLAVRLDPCPPDPA